MLIANGSELKRVSAQASQMTLERFTLYIISFAFESYFMPNTCVPQVAQNYDFIPPIS